MRKRRERDRARHAAQTASERQATSQQRSTHERERMAAETTEEGETRLQQMSTNQHERLAVETPEERELRLECYSTRYMEQQYCEGGTPTVSTVFHPSQDVKILCKHGHIGYTDMLHLFRKIF